MTFQVPDIVKFLWKDVVWRMNPAEKVIYLTFDDGPNPQITPQVLDILDEHGVKATFFCVGDNVRKYPDTFSEVTSRGHAVGNHTFNHIKGFKFSTADYVANVQKASEYIESRILRPPHGQIKFSQVRALKKNYKIIMWDLITFDYDKNVTPEQISRIVKKQTRNGSIVVFHDSLKAERNVLNVLPVALNFWKNQGYDFRLLT